MKPILVLGVITSLMTILCAVDTSKPFDLTTILGEKFKNCRIMKATPEGLTVVHDKGVVRLSFALLSEEWKQQFNYDPAVAREFAQAEEEKRKAAEAVRAEMKRKRDLSEEAQLAELAAAERRRLEADASAVKEYQDSIKSANTPPPPLAPLAPLPGDATPGLNAAIASPGAVASQPIMQTEVVVPTVSPVGDPYTPSRIRSQTYIMPGSYYGGYPFGYYQPIFSSPGYSCPITPCPTSSIIPGVHGTISTGGMTLHIGP